MSAIARIVSITAPSAAPAGTYVPVEVTLQNVGDATGYLQAAMQYWEPQPPAGWSYLTAMTPGLTWLEPGATAVWSGQFIMTTWPGATGTTVRVTVLRYGGQDAEGSDIWYRDDTRDIAIAIGTPPSPSGRITNLLYWYEGLANWVDLVALGAPTVPLNTGISLLIGWVNTSTVTFAGHIDLIIIRPDGSQVAPAAVVGQDRIVGPGSGTTVQFAPAALDQYSAWRARAVLSS